MRPVRATCGSTGSRGEVNSSESTSESTSTNSGGRSTYLIGRPIKSTMRIVRAIGEGVYLPGQSCAPYLQQAVGLRQLLDDGVLDGRARHLRSACTTRHIEYVHII